MRDLVNAEVCKDLRQLPYENHTVTTEDGYILTLFRATQKNPKGIIVMFHPIIQDSTTWFLGGSTSYGLTFINQGYEVWFLNFRGVTYSDRHVKNLTGKEYWNWSFHELGYYDISAVFRHVYSVTNQKAISFSMSIGSAAAAVYASERPDEAKKYVNLFIQLATPAFLSDDTTVIRLIIPFIPIIKVFLKIFNIYSLPNRTFLIKFIINLVIFFNGEWLSTLVLPFLFGGGPFEMDPSRLPAGLAEYFQPSSVKTLLHFSQLITNGNQFVQYDYGKSKNLDIYSSEKPPRYPLESINVPVYLMYCDQDNLANPKGVEIFYQQLSDSVKPYGLVKFSGCGHADFIIGKTIPLLVQNSTLALLDKINQENNE
ncbi:lipase 1-like isoform X2 [Anthonomus grandis grandis]|uniref:lipase 1-like isoform X2 n=1 Tax=Anthonomus grandis grandis TaxID=2921223 RepID=UPI002166B1C8|nr:lipase 1-like isoform X2 [Anthonomus grandis grandis]